MNANPAYAAAVAPALDASDYRASPEVETMLGDPGGPESTRERDRVRVRDRAGVTSLENFDVYRVSLDACRACAPIAATLTAILKDQLLRASSSVVLNIAEGFGSSSRGVKRRHYEIARGSAVECIGALDLAPALGVVDGSATDLRRREPSSRAPR